jgi:hypothetical protein
MSLRARSEDEITLSPGSLSAQALTLSHRNGRGKSFLLFYPRPLCQRRQSEGSDVQPNSIFQRSEYVRGLLFRTFHGVSVAALILFAASCDPVLNIGGTFFPGWMASILIGSALSFAIRYLFVFTGLEPHVGPLALIYTSLGVLLSVASWLILYWS